MKSNYLVITARNVDVRGTLICDSAYDTTVKGEKVKRVLTPKGEVVEVSPKSNTEKLDIKLNPENLWKHSINLSLEGVDVEGIRKWAKEHPQMDKLGIDGSSPFVYTIDDEIIEEASVSYEEKVEVYSKFNLLDSDQRKSVSVHFGLDPWELSEKELVMRLVGQEGLVSSDEKLRREFLHNMDRIFDEVSLNMRSAVQCGIITVTKDSVYVFNGEVLGSSVESSVLMLKQREDLYSAIRRELKGKGKFLTTQDKKQEYKEQEIKEKKQEAVEAELDDLEVPVKPKGKKPVAA